MNFDQIIVETGKHQELIQQAKKISVLVYRINSSSLFKQETPQANEVKQNLQSFVACLEQQEIIPMKTGISPEDAYQKIVQPLINRLIY